VSDDLPTTPDDPEGLLTPRRKRVLALVVLVVGLGLLAPPAFGDGPDPDTVYRYEAVPVDPEGGSTGVLVALPDAEYVYGDVAEAVVAAENETYERTTAAPGTRRLVDTLEPVRFVRESGQGRFYRVDLGVDGRTVRLDSERVDGRTLVEALSVTPEAVPGRVRSLATAENERGRTLETTRPLTPQLLTTGDGYVAVVPTGESIEPDPRRTEKLLAMVAGLVLTFAGAVAYTRV
jgi:hypothetical protein